MKRSWWSLITIGTGLAIMAGSPTTSQAYKIKKSERLMRILSLLFLLAIFGVNEVSANLCDPVKDLSTIQETKDEIEFYKELFPNADYHGSQDYNGFVLECNRRRDNKGDEVRKMLTIKDWAEMKSILKESDLSPYLFSAKYKFFGIAWFQMSYLIWKEGGVWKMVLPYDPIINDEVENRIDFNMTHAGNLYDKDQVDEGGSDSSKTYALKPTAQAISVTKCGTTTFFAGKEKKYDGQNGVDAHKRDPANQHISLGKIQYSYDDSKGSYWVMNGCRVKKDEHLYGTNPATGNFEKILPADWVLNNFEKVAEEYWSIPDNFELYVLLKGHNEDRLASSVKTKINNHIKNNDYLTIRFGTKFLPGANQMYKTNAWQPNNFSTMTGDGTYTHEVGHAFGLDDEYAQGSSSKNKDHCANSQFDQFDGISGSTTYTIDNYTMCNGYGTQTNTIYHYIAVTRYILGETCKEDQDCGAGRYCNNRLGLNRCLADGTKGVNQSCIKDKECTSGKCEKDTCVCKSDGDCPNGQACYTPIGKANYCASTSKALGASCSQNSQCASDKCQQDQCVCKGDGDCPNGQACFTPVGKANYCASTNKALGASCAKDDQCASGKCQQDQCVCKGDGDCPNGQACYTPIGKANYCASTSKALGASCTKDSQCASDKCEQDKCVCQSNGDCPNGQACYTPVGKANYCASTSKALGASCTKDSQCASDKCEQDKCVCQSNGDCPDGQTCYTPVGKANYCASTSKALGASCSQNSQCASDKCEQGECVCQSDNDCPDSQKCKTPVTKKNYCTK